MDHWDDALGYICGGFVDPFSPAENDSRDADGLSAEQIREFTKRIEFAEDIRGSINPISPAEWDDWWDPIVNLCIYCAFEFPNPRCPGCLRAYGKGKQLLIVAERALNEGMNRSSGA